MVLRRRLSTGLPLSVRTTFKVQNKKTDLLLCQVRVEIKYEVFGGLAIMVVFTTLDPWLCVAAFRRVCYYRISYWAQFSTESSLCAFHFRKGVSNKASIM